MLRSIECFAASTDNTSEVAIYGNFRILLPCCLASQILNLRLPDTLALLHGTLDLQTFNALPQTVLKPQTSNTLNPTSQTFKCSKLYANPKPESPNTLVLNLKTL